MGGIGGGGLTAGENSLILIPHDPKSVKGTYEFF